MSLDELERLLALQEHDTALDRLRHRRASLPERAELDARSSELRAQQAARLTLQTRRDAVHSEERRLDDEARSIEVHAAEVDKRLYSGTISSPRELQAMQSDLEMLRRQLSDLEDQELEVMEQREALDEQLAALDASIGSSEARTRALRDAIAAAEAEIDREMAGEAATRAEAAAPLPDSLVRDYERRRAQNKGAGAARLVGTTCQACHLTIPSTEAEHIRRAAGSEVAYCDNCGAILVP
ncbi:MAG TPA: C4-type zinc ribbon domain-containing protein [Acidimicrobiia bacterium]|nr:C4-type zinc ribbon domain-containing protein [Acidimicrobiia bacterium]